MAMLYSYHLALNSHAQHVLEKYQTFSRKVLKINSFSSSAKIQHKIFQILNFFSHKAEQSIGNGLIDG